MAAEAESAQSGSFDKSKHLDPAEKDQAAQHAAPPAVVIHEILRTEGKAELGRRPGAVFWSGLAAGLSMGFSFLALALIQSKIPEGPPRYLIGSVGYSLGFVIVVLGRQELFTEKHPDCGAPLLVRRDWGTWLSLLRFWAVVLAANLLGTLIFASLLTKHGLFDEDVRASLQEISNYSVSGPFWPTAIKSIFAGWLIALMIWVLPSARSARLLVIMLLTYVVAIGRFSHVIAGSVEAFYAMFAGQASIYQYLVGFFVPTILGNTIGGVALVALLNHAPLISELQN
jgi:formate-nitrite transporter family protein